jgi:hypothetical protein
MLPLLLPLLPPHTHAFTNTHDNTAIIIIIIIIISVSISSSSSIPGRRPVAAATAAALLLLSLLLMVKHKKYHYHTQYGCHTPGAADGPAVALPLPPPELLLPCRHSEQADVGAPGTLRRACSCARVCACVGVSMSACVLAS